MSAAERSSRYAGSLLVVVLASSIGIVLASQFGKGFEVQLHRIEEGVGRLQALRLPLGARRFSDVTSFVVSMKGADDFGRVYVNNYVVSNREATNLFYSEKSSPESRATAAKMMVDRKVNKVGVVEARGYLRPGVNVVVIELENAIGPCETNIDISVNGIRLEKFPQQLPDQFQVDAGAVSAPLLRKFQEAESAKAAIDPFVPSSLDNVLCSRRAFTFFLDKT